MGKTTFEKLTDPTLAEIGWFLMLLEMHGIVGTMEVMAARFAPAWLRRWIHL